MRTGKSYSSQNACHYGSNRVRPLPTVMMGSTSVCGSSPRRLCKFFRKRVNNGSALEDFEGDSGAMDTIFEFATSSSAEDEPSVDGSSIGCCCKLPVAVVLLVTVALVVAAGTT